MAWLTARLTGPPMALAEAVMPSLRPFRFDSDQIKMSHEDNVCDHSVAEGVFDLRMRSFEEELASYAGSIK